MRDKVESTRGVAAAVAARRRVIYAFISRTRISSSRPRCNDFERERLVNCQRVAVPLKFIAIRRAQPRKATCNASKLLGSCLRGVIGSSPSCFPRFYFIPPSFHSFFFLFATRMTRRCRKLVAVTKLNHGRFRSLFARFLLARRFRFVARATRATGSPVAGCLSIADPLDSGYRRVRVTALQRRVVPCERAAES